MFFCFLSLFLTGTIKFFMLFRLALNFRSSCFYLASAWVTYVVGLYSAGESSSWLQEWLVSCHWTN